MSTQRLPALAVPGLTGYLGLLIGLAITGATATGALGDPGALVRWGLPVITTTADLCAALTLGALLLCATVLPQGPATQQARQVAAVASIGWTLAALARTVLDYASVAGVPLTSPDFGSQLHLYVTQLERGQLLLGTTVMAALTAMLVALIRTPVGAGVASLAAAAALTVISFTGHAAGAADHELAVSSLWLHLLGVAGWAGGLTTLAAASRKLSAEQMEAVLPRYSRLALLAILLVLGSGIGNSVLRIGGWENLGSSYGMVLLTKAALLIALGIVGFQQRRRVIASGAGAMRGLFLRLAGLEMGLMGLALGLGVALAGSAPPVSDTQPITDPTPAEILTGRPLPPQLTLGRLLTQFSSDILWLAVVLFLAASYLAGVRSLHARGDRWPVHRTVLWLIGLAVLLYVTCGGIAVYGRVLFSAHMVQHMALTMVAPLILTFGAPITLLLRACPARHDGSRGPREWVMGLVESPWMRLMSHPVVAAINFAGSIIVFYYTPLFGLALRTHVGHELMMVHFIAAGYLFAQAIVGIDPGPTRLPYPLRLVLLFATMGFHAFFGVTMMGMKDLIQATYFSSLGTGIDLLADQQRGGSLAWGIGEIPTLILAIVMAALWARSDDRESIRRDRAADRDQDAELNAYNAMLSNLHQK